MNHPITDYVQKNLKFRKLFASQISILLAFNFLSKSESNSEVNTHQEQSAKQITKELQNIWGSSIFSLIVHINVCCDIWWEASAFVNAM